MRYRTLMKTCMALLLSVSMLCAVAGNADAARKIKLNNSGWATVDHPIHTWFSEEPCRLLNLVSGDKFDVRIHPSFTLVGMQDSYQAVLTGMTPFNIVQCSATPGVFPLMELFTLPGLFPNQATSNIVAWHMLKKYPQFEQELDPDVVRISTQVHMRADLHTRMPIRTLAELKNKNIGCQNHQVAEALAALGATVSVLDVGDMYTSLDKGIVDGVACAWGSVDTYRLYEIVKYHTLIGVCPFATHLLANRKIVWDNLTEQQQNIMKALEPSFQNCFATGNALSAESVRYKHAIPENGHEIINLNDDDMLRLRNIMEPLWNAWAEEMEKKGLPGKQMLSDAIHLIDVYSDN